MTVPPGDPYPRDLLRGPAEVVAPRLLGCSLVAASPDGDVVLRVSEVEAYAGVGQDPGSHAHRGPRPRNATMFATPGLLYVYFTYGMHWCANVVAHPEPGQADGQDGQDGEDGRDGRVGGPGTAAGAVLLRAGEVVGGVDLARRRRPTARSGSELARGPARLTKALGITGEDDGTDLLDPASRVRLLAPACAPAEVRSGPRVGVAGEGAATPWRWWDASSPTVSAYRAAQPRRRSTRAAPPAAPPVPPLPPAGDEGDPAPGGAP